MDSSTSTIADPTRFEHPLPLELQFVTYSSNSAPRPSRELRATVRAHVTRRQHRQRRHVDPFRPVEANPSSRSAPAISTVQSDTPLRSLTRTSRTEAKSAGESSESDRSLPSSSTSLSTPSSLGSTQEDPFWTLPVDYSPLFPPIIAHYIQNLALPVADLDGPSHQSLLRTHWFPMAMMSPATMYSVLQMGACHYYRISSPKFGDDRDTNMGIRPQVILTLKARVLDEVNRCLRSTDIHIAVGDTTIGAVAKLAAFEAVFGDEEAYRQHMLGLKRMLQVRRALRSAIEPVDSFLRRLVTWIDVNAAHFTGRTGKSVLDLGVIIKEPDPLRFAGTTQCRSRIQFLVDR